MQTKQNILQPIYLGILVVQYIGKNDTLQKDQYFVDEYQNLKQFKKYLEVES